MSGGAEEEKEAISYSPGGTEGGWVCDVQPGCGTAGRLDLG